MKPIQGQSTFFRKNKLFSTGDSILPVQQETSQAAVEELSKYISIRAQTFSGNQLEKQVVIALRKLSDMSDVGGKQSYSPAEMFTWRENYFMGSTIRIGILAICSDWSLCTLLQQYAPRCPICLLNEAGGEVLQWAVGSWRSGTRWYSSSISHNANLMNAVNKFQMWIQIATHTDPVT